MIENDYFIVSLVVIISFIVVLLFYFIYELYLISNKKRMMIEILSDSSHHILDNKKKINSIKTHEENFIQNKLNYGGFSYEYAHYIFYFISVSFGVLVGIFIFIIMKSSIALVVSSLVFSLLPYLILEKLISNRQEEFNFGLKSIIDKVTSMMKSGVGFEQAFKKSIATSKSKLTQDVFNIYLQEKDIIGEDKAFEKMFKIVESREFRIFYLVISIGRQSGGKFSNTLETLRKTLQDQGTIKQEIVSSTKEIKVGTYMIIALTIGIYMMMNSAFEGALNSHFFGTSDGKLQMFFIIIWVAFGIFVNNMLTKIKE